eukprot:jgi/Chrzof1/14794/Cz09g16130.t1
MINSGAKEFLIDGFPRALDQADAFERMVKPCEMILFFDCPEDEMERRLLKRGETSGRTDDNAETIKKRFHTFIDQSMPVIEHYEHQGKAHRISAVPPPEEVFKTVQQVLEGKQELPADAKVIFVLGGPGSGKGTQCERIVAKYGYKHLSAGDLLRDEVKSGSDLGIQCEQIMKEGKLVPMEVIIGLLKKAMINSGAKEFLIDGFPRALDQADAFERMVKPCEMVLFFDCPEDEMERRLLKRGETSGRSDDNAETIKKRFHTFIDQSMPVIEHYEHQGKAHRISAVPPPEEVFKTVQQVLEGKQELPADAKVIFVLGGPGSGKGTQCERIVAKYGYKHLSAGDLLRDEVKSGSDLGIQCEQIMKEGKLVPMEVIIGLLKKAMINSGAKEFLIDGFPRALDQADAFERMVKPCEMVLFFDCPEDEMERRLLKRGETSGRSDDNAETIKKRFHTFIDQSMPVIEHYEHQGKAHRISAVPAPEEVFNTVQQILEGKSSPQEANGGEELVVPEVEGQLSPDASIIFVLGGPGSGKGTQCERIVAKYGYKHLSAGDLLRDEVKSGSDLGKQCEQIMKEGKLVPMEVIIGLLKKAMVNSGAKEFLIDGFPRALDQADAFERMVKPCEMVLFFDCPEDEMERRLFKRGETSGRTDDNAETIKKRFHTFINQSMPVIEHYEHQGKAHRISAVPPPEEVFKTVQNILEGKSSPQEATAEEELVVPEVEGQLSPNASIIFVLGGPGSGKGTQCERIVAKYGYKHLSAGNLLRDEVKSGSAVGKKCEQIMKEGKLVPMEVTIALLKNAMVKSNANEFLIDGFPRALDQAHAFEDMIKPCRMVLFFDCPEDEMERRLLKRGETSGRTDDNAETIKKRFHTFIDQSMPVIEHYEHQGKAHRISAVPAPEEVFNVVQSILEPAPAVTATPTEPAVAADQHEQLNHEPPSTHDEGPESHPLRLPAVEEPEPALAYA